VSGQFVSKAAESKCVLTFSSFQQYDENLNGYFLFHPVWAVRSVPGQLSVVSYYSSPFSGQLLTRHLPVVSFNPSPFSGQL
jgi:hypothetical protein